MIPIQATILMAISLIAMFILGRESAQIFKKGGQANVMDSDRSSVN